MFRYSVQRYGTWEWLDLDAKLETDGPEWALSTYGVMEATLPPAAGNMRAEDRRLIYEEWGTLIHAETGSGAARRRWTGIVTRSELDGGQWKLKIREWAGYLDGMPIERRIIGVEEDPADLLRKVWAGVNLMCAPGLNVTVAGSTPIRLGTTSTQLVSEARAVMKARKKELDAYTKAKNAKKKDLAVLVADKSTVVAEARRQVAAAQRYVTQLVNDGAPPFEVEEAMQEVREQQTLLEEALTSYTEETGTGKAALTTAKDLKSVAQVAYDLAQEAYNDAVDQERRDGGAYVISPDGISDAHDAIADLTKHGFEWTTSTTYSEGAPVLTVHVHYPRAGRVRDDLIFEQGINIVSDLEPVRGGDEYANAGIGIGAGEGRNAIRQTVENTTRRMRRPAVIEDKSLNRDRLVNAALRAEIRARSGRAYIDEITVIDHPMTPIGSWAVGDEIRVTGTVPNMGRYSELHRIVSWQMVGDTKAKLRLQLSSTL